MKMILMGTGTSQGVPVIGCNCEVCASPRPEDKRMRCSAYVECDGGIAGDHDGTPAPTTNLLIDCGPEFRIQALRAHITRLDAVLMTHGHGDHAHGLDDVRVFSHTKSAPAAECDSASMSETQLRIKRRQDARGHFPLKEETEGLGLPIYANADTVNDLLFRFAYVFNPHHLGGGLPKFHLLDCGEFSQDEPLVIGSVSAIPIPMTHGALAASGWLLTDTNTNRSIAYLTDCNFIGEEALAILDTFRGAIDHLVIDGLRIEPHPSHCTFAEALAYADRIGATHTWLTHFTHNLFHAEIQEYLDDTILRFPNLKKIVAEGGSVAPGHDGLELHTATLPCGNKSKTALQYQNGTQNP